MKNDLQFLGETFLAASKCKNLESFCKNNIDESDNGTAAADGNVSNPKPSNSCSGGFCSRQKAKKNISVSVCVKFIK